MNVSEFALIALGLIFNVITFSIGCAVGVGLADKRKDLKNGNRNRYRYRYEDEGFQHYADDAED